MLTENLIKGQLIELKVQEEFLRYGFDISIPTYNSSRYDLLVDTGKEILKIQIKKSIGKTKNSFCFECVSSNVRSNSMTSKRKYTEEEIDYFATVWKDKVYLIPVEETSVSKTLRDDGTFNDYLVENIFSNYKRLSDEQLYNYSDNPKKYCIDCGIEIHFSSERCVQCNAKRQQVVERPSREELKTLIKTNSFLQIGKKYGVTDNTIRKWCKKENLPTKRSEIQKIREEDWNNI